MQIAIRLRFARACRSLSIAFCFAIPFLSEASHFEVEHNFDFYAPGTQGSFIWDGSGGIVAAGSPFGGNYLAFDGQVTDSFGLGFLDVLPAQTSDFTGPHALPRLAKISFDLVDFDPLTEAFNVAVSVYSGGEADSFSFDIDTSDITGGSNKNFSFAVEFVLASKVGSDCCTDMGITYRKLSAGAWGIDNVVVDWGRVVPLPAASWFFLSAIAGLFGFKRLWNTKA